MPDPYRISKEQAAEFAKRERTIQRELAKMHRQRHEQARRNAKLGYDPTRPNHLMHDSLGDPATCAGDHNHPEHIGEA